MQFDLNDDDLFAIDRGLQELPFRIAAPILQKLNAQIAANRHAQQAVTAPAQEAEAQ